MTKNTKLLLLTFLLFLLTACAPSATVDIVAQPSKTPLPTSTLVPTSTTTLTPPPTPTNTPVPGRGEVDAVLNAENDAEREVAAIAFAEWMNDRVPEEAYVELFPEFGNYPGSRLFWSEENSYGGSIPVWSSTDTVDNEPDYSLLPEPIVPGMTNDAGENMVFIDGEWSALPKVNIPGLGEMSLSEMVVMNQDEFKQGVVDYLNMIDDEWSYLDSTADDRYALPVIMYKNTRQTSDITGNTYHGNGDLKLGRSLIGGRGLQMPGIIFSGIPTNHVLMPLVDPETGELFGWQKIIQGITSPRTLACEFSDGDDVPTVHTVVLQGSAVYEFELRPFGAEPSDSFAVLLPHKVAAQDYEIFGQVPVLEHGGDTGIGSSPDILNIIFAESIEEMLNLISKHRITVVYPDIVLHQN